MKGDVCAIEINSGDRRLAAIVIGAERQGQCAAAARLVFEGRNERPSHATQTTIPPDDERVQFPDTPVVLRKATDPPKQEAVLQRAARRDADDAKSFHWFNAIDAEPHGWGGRSTPPRS